MSEDTSTTSLLSRRHVEETKTLFNLSHLVSLFPNDLQTFHFLCAQPVHCLTVSINILIIAADEQSHNPGDIFHQT